MAKKNRHSWDPLHGTGRLNHAECMWCQCQKWFSVQLGRVVYESIHGSITYNNPNCTHESPPRKTFKTPDYFNK
jgi:hypothetical protein